MDISTRLIARVADDDWSDVWRASGAMGLSGRRDGPPLPVPQALPRVMTSAAELLAAHCGLEVDGPALLGERAALLGLTRNGQQSCGGGTRLLRAGKDWIAVSLARDDDRASVPAWLEADLPLDVDETELWTQVSNVVAGRGAARLVEQGRMLGMPVARL